MKKNLFTFLLITFAVGMLSAQTVENQLVQLLPGTSQFFGTAVAITGDFAFSTGDLFTSQMGGRVRVFKQANGLWTQTQSISRANNCGVQENACSQFGAAVDAAGVWLMVGAPGWDSDCLGNIGPDGVTFIYRRTGDNYSLHQTISDPSFNVNERYGNSVSVSGEWLFVGAPGKRIESVSNVGAVFVYRFNNQTESWDAFQTLTSATTRDFGHSVDVDGTKALIGAKYNTENSNTNSGAAYFWTFDGTSWVEQQKETIEGQVRSANFGETVAISGNHAAIGTAYRKVVYTYKFSGGVWTRQNTLTDNTDEYGQRISMEGDYLLVSNYQKYTGSLKTGVAMLYKYIDANWSLVETFIPSNGAASDAFGKSLALKEGKVIIGSPSKSSATGATYVYTGAIEVPVLSADFVSSSIIKAIYQDLTFTDLSTSEGTTISSWSWDFDGNGIEDSPDRTPVYQYTSPGVYPVRLTISDGTLTSSKTKLVTIISQSADTCFSYIPVQGLESDGMGTAAWNVLSAGGAEGQKVGHSLPQPPASIQQAYYYLASRNYGSIDAQSTGGMRATAGMERWPELAQALVDNGYTPEDIEISFGLMSLGNDVEDSDWSLSNNIEYRRYQGGRFSIRLDGENFISGLMPQFDMTIQYNAYLGQTDKISGETAYALPEDDSQSSSQAVKNVAAAFLADCGTAPLKFMFSSIQSANQFEFSANYRNGGFFEIQQGFIIKSCLGGGTLTAIDAADELGYQIKTQSGKIVITGLTGPTHLRLIDVTGKQLIHRYTQDSEVEIELGASGFYLLIIGNEKIKVIN